MIHLSARRRLGVFAVAATTLIAGSTGAVPAMADHCEKKEIKDDRGNTVIIWIC